MIFIRRGDFSEPIQPVATATCVRVPKCRRIMTDGTFTETREQLGQYFLIDASELDTPTGIAQIHVSHKGIVVFRPIREIAGLPEKR